MFYDVYMVFIKYVHGLLHVQGMQMIFSNCHVQKPKFDGNLTNLVENLKNLAEKDGHRMRKSVRRRRRRRSAQASWDSLFPTLIVRSSLVE